ncbi:MAG: chemotaxis protein CheB [Acidobacteriaceae bacterium]
MRPRASKPVFPAEESPGKIADAQNAFFPIVAVGASAGGLEAYTEFFHALPVDTGMAFVLVQHLDPSHHSLLAEILSKATRMPVDEVRSGTRIRPNRVYVIPPDAFMAIEECAFVLTPRSKDPGQHLSVNFFMRSLAAERKSVAIGIVLSGTGADGTLGVTDIKAAGGITFAQDPATAKYDGMPRSAIASGCVDFILPPKAIAKELERIHRHPYVNQVKDEADIEPSPAGEDDFNGILNLLRKVSGADFSQYKPNTLYRRAMRRVMILRLGSLGEYAKHLRGHPEETEKLYDDVLIPVTSFFRDIETFEALKKHIYPAIVKDKGNKGAIRMWAPGCSTGEETYSLAMTLLEFLGNKAASFQVQIFGTDLNEKGIQKARAGLYRESIAEEISPERLRRFFVKEANGYRINKAVRDMCIFARQNLAYDPPFSQMNVVACRNLLIYLGPELQKKIIPILHYALKPSGFLVLGSSESISGFPSLFSTVDKKHKIYAKKSATSRLHYNFSQTRYPAGSGADVAGKARTSQGPQERKLDVEAEADRLVLKHHAPVGVVINNAMEVVQFRGRTTPYLEPAPGKPSLNLLKLARNGLALELRSLIGGARKKHAPVNKNNISFVGNGHKRVLNLSVSPLGDKDPSEEERYFLVLFEDVTKISGPREKLTAKPGTAKGREFTRLKQELAATQASLRAATESEDAVREEFQSANEEILSANEELQSTNEELETSKEELQSANEELNSLNNELGHKNAELHDLNNDLSNFLNSTKIPVVMLDRDLRIRRLTPSADQLVKAVSSDVGRPIADIRLNIKVPDLEEMIAKVLESLQPAERDVQDLQDRWHSLHILPYRTLDNKIDGIVLVLLDIDAMKSANERLRHYAEFLRGMIDTVREPLLVLDAELRVIAVNKSFQSTFKVSAVETIGQPLFKLGNGQWNIPILRELLKEVLSKRQAISDFEVEHDFENLGHRTLLLNARTLVQPQDAQPMVLLAMEDLTERKLAETAMIKQEKLAVSGRLAAVLAHEINNPLQAISNLMSILQGSAKLDEQDRSYVTTATEELGRVTDLTRQSLGFFRESAAPRAVDIEETLEGILKLYDRRMKEKGTTVQKQYLSSEIIHSYPGEIRQVFATLLVNATDASLPGGTIAIRVRNASNGNGLASPGPASGDSAIQGIRITIADSGVGISAQNKARIFEPFFTTKGEHGIGLGLWVAYGIVNRLGGSIRMRSSVRPGKSGTCFSIFLPLRNHSQKADTAT